MRKGNGLAVIAPGEVDVITVAGMGGALIRDILESGKEKLEGVTRLILQPNIARIIFVNGLLRMVGSLSMKNRKRRWENLRNFSRERGNVVAPYSENKQAELFMGPF